jgi:cation diffusion facilitator CzcD-associated flavoprotein CzcO
MQRMSPFMEKFPLVVADRMLRDTERLFLGDLSAYGLPRHPAGGVSRMIKSGVAPAIDDGFVAALKAGRLKVVPPVERFTATGVDLRDGRHLEADVVIAATGYRTGLEPMVGHLDVLDDNGVPVVNGGRTADHCPGLWFIGMRPTLSGYFRAACRDSQQIATAIAARHTRWNRASLGHVWPEPAKNAEA